MPRRFATATAILLVSGCSDVHTDYYDRLKSLSTDSVAIDDKGACTLPDESKFIIDDSRASTKTKIALSKQTLLLKCDRDFLVNRADNAKAISDRFNVPMIGLAVGATAALLYRSSTDLPGGIGIAAGGLAGLDAYFAPEKNVDIYIKAGIAADCGANAGQTIADARYEYLATARTALLADIATATVYKAPSPDSAKNLSDAITAANQAVTAADTEFAALNDAPHALAKLRSQVRFSVMKSTERQAVNFADERQSIVAALQASTESTSNASDARAKLFEAETKQSAQPKDSTVTPAGTAEADDANKLANVEDVTVEQKSKPETASPAGAPAGTPAPAVVTPPTQTATANVAGQPATTRPSNIGNVSTASVIARLQWDVQWVQNVTPKPSYTSEVAAITACGIGL